MYYRYIDQKKCIYRIFISVQFNSFHSHYISFLLFFSCIPFWLFLFRKGFSIVHVRPVCICCHANNSNSPRGCFASLLYIFFSIIIKKDSMFKTGMILQVQYVWAFCALGYGTRIWKLKRDASYIIVSYYIILYLPFPNWRWILCLRLTSTCCCCPPWR